MVFASEAVLNMALAIHNSDFSLTQIVNRKQIFSVSFLNQLSDYQQIPFVLFEILTIPVIIEVMLLKVFLFKCS